MCSGRSPKRRLPSTGGRSASQAWAAAYLLFLLLPPVILVNDSGLSLERLRDHTAGAHKAEIRSARSRKKTRVLPEAAGRATDATRSGYLRGAWSRLALGADVFTGALWTCAQARDLGLIDSLGGAGMVARDVVGAEAQVDYLPVRDPSEGLVGHLATVLAEHGYFSALVAVSSLQSETWVRIGNRQCRLPDGLQCICLHWTAVGSTTPFKYQPFPSLVAISPVQSET